MSGEFCNICKQPFDSKNRMNCGGDCRKCMATIGEDPDCMKCNDHPLEEFIDGECGMCNYEESFE